MDQEAMEEHKAKLVQQELQGLDVTYSRHNPKDGSLTPNMAQGKGFSIVWHEYSYGNEYEDEVELWLTSREEQPRRVLISELRKEINSL